MIVTLSAALVGSLISVQQNSGVIIMRHDVGPRYSRTDYESACGPADFRVRFRNGPNERGLVEHVLINGQAVPGAAETLDVRAARRSIDSIEIMNCGLDPDQPEFRGVLNLSEAESRVASMRPTLFFRITRQGRDGWRLTMDD